MSQLSSRDSELASSLITNPCTRIAFRLGEQDARRLAGSFSSFESSDLQRLGRGEAICRVERSDFDFNLETLPISSKNGKGTLGTVSKKAIVDWSRSTYSTPRSEVESQSYTDRPARGTIKTPAEREVEQPTPKDKRTTQPDSRSKSKPIREIPVEIQKPGRGGRQHKYLQELLKRTGESLGMRASVEKSILDGSGSVDLALESKELSIACEISITSDEKSELHNVQKCLSTGFDYVVVICPDPKKLAGIKSYVSEHIDEAVLNKVQFVSPEDAISFIKKIAVPETEQTIGGYKVTVRYGNSTTDERELRRQAVSDVILKALKRMKDSD